MTRVPDATVDDATTPPKAADAEDPAVRSAASVRRRRIDWVGPVVVTVVAVVMFGWNVGRNEWSNRYYAAAVRSMATNWHAFRYASIDVGGWVTVDKPPLAFWLQALSVRVFGFHPWSMMLPTVVLGAASVALLMATVRRVAGQAAELLAGGLFALTPVTVAMSRSNMPDITLTFFLVVAGWAVVRGATSPLWRWPVLIGLASAAGFLSKSVAVCVALPAIGIGYLVADRRRLGQRVMRGAAGLGVFVGVVGAWIASVDIGSLPTRPWVGGSSDGSVWKLVFDYNVSVLGGEGGLAPGVGRGPGPLGGLFLAFGGERGVGRMFNAAMGDQVMWWFPLAVLGAAAGIFGTGRQTRREPLFSATVMWTMWALVAMAVFSYTKGVLHPYYVVVLAPPLAALAAIGVVRTWEAQDGRWRWAGVVALLATFGVQLVLLRRNGSYTWLRPVLVIVAISALIMVCIGGILRRRSEGDGTTGSFSVASRRGVGATVGVVLLIAPALWSVSAVRHQVGGLFPAARPGTDSFSFGPPVSGSPYGFSDFTDDTLRWLDSRRTSETWSVAMASAMVGQDAIIAGHRVVALGGFSGGDHSADTEQVAKAVAAGRLRYVLAGGGNPFGLPDPEVFDNVRSACAEVPAETWGGTGMSGIYDCKGAAEALRRR